jgi:hypothetical protein
MRALIVASLVFIASSASAKVDDLNTLIDDARETRAEVQEQIQERNIQSETSAEKAIIKDNPASHNTLNKVDIHRPIVSQHRPEDMTF